MNTGLEGLSPLALRELIIAALAAPFTSEGNAPRSGTTLEVAHGLSATPTSVRAYLVCATADLGYSVGDIVDCCTVCDNSGATTNTSTTGTDLRSAYIIGANATTVFVVYSSQYFNTTVPYYIRHKTTGVITKFTAASWTLKIIAKL